MEKLLLPLFLLLTIVFPMAMLAPTKVAAAVHDCPITKCTPDGPVIKFPFRLKHHPLHCGHPEFEVTCFANLTMIKLSSSSGLFPIQKIDYESYQFQVYDADGCLPRALLNFTFSVWSPIQPVRHYVFYNSCGFDLQYYPDLLNTTLLNCSEAQGFSTESSRGYYMWIKCLSVPGHYQVVAALQSTHITDVPETCFVLGALHLPIRNVDGDIHRCESGTVLFLEWPHWGLFVDPDLPICPNCSREEGEGCGLNDASNQMECFQYASMSPVPNPQGVSARSIAIGVSISCFVLILVTVVAILYRVKQSNGIEEKENQIEIERFLKDHKSHVATRYSYADIKKMTNGFKKKLGEGGFGTVFRGKLPNGVPVAVKVLNDSKGNGEDFVNEVGTIGRIHHVNVVRLLGFSAERGNRAVIYELMPNRSLEKFISSKDQSSNNASFDWEKLHNIVNGIAKGMEYLHQGCDQRILHFDIKPHNILLDHDFNPKISDFGLAKLCSKEDSIISMTAARGTVGYIAPELFNGGNFGSVSHKSDVYSFGMLVLEVVGARKVDALTTSSNDEVYFPELIYNRLIQGEALGLKLDGDEDGQIAKKLVIVALWCIQWFPVNRPSMKAVVRMLEGAFESLIMPPNPFAPTSAQTDQPRTTLSG